MSYFRAGGIMIYSSRFEITYRLRVFYVDVSMLLFYVKLDKFIHDI